MGRKIDLESPLSEADLRFLMARDRWADIDQNAANLGMSREDVIAEAEGDTGNGPDVRNPRIGQDAPRVAPDATHPAPASLGQRQRLAAQSPEVTIETEDFPYEEWHNKQLRDENHLRGLPMYGNKQSLADRLRAWDKDHDLEPGDESPEGLDLNTEADAYTNMDYDDLSSEADSRGLEYDDDPDDEDAEAESLRAALRADDAESESEDDED